MNFLELCQRTVKESGGVSGTLVTVAGQTGEMGKIVNWVQAAYEDIQNLNQTWNFLRFDFSFETITAASTYTPVAVGLDELARWKQDGVRSYLTSTGVAAQQWLEPVDWDFLHDVRLFGVGSTLTGVPTEFAIRPDKSIVLWPTPNAIYTVTGEYWKRAQTLAANTDTPLLPVQLHMAIVWGAVKYYAADQGAAETYSTAATNYTRLLNRLEADQLPQISFGDD